MGDLTLANLRDDVTIALEDQEFEGVAFLNRRINQAYRRLTWPSVFEHPDLEATVDLTLALDTASYALPADHLATMNRHGVFVIFSDGREDRLERQTYARLLEDRYVVTGSGAQPSRYAIHDRSIHINVYPSAAFIGQPLRVNYYKQVTLLSADGDSTEIEGIWDFPITQLAASYAWALLGQQQRADYFAAAAMAYVNDLIGNLELNATDPSEGMEPYLSDTGGYVETTW